MQRTDFVAVPTHDRDRAAKFYGETLGITRNPIPHGRSPEFETGNLTLTLELLDDIGDEFQPLSFGTSGLMIRHRYAPYGDGTQR